MTQPELDRRTLELAEQKIVSAGSGLPHYPRFGTGGAFSDIFLWDTVFTCCWAKHFLNELPVYQSLDNFYFLQSETGFISRQYLPDGRAKWSEKHPISFAPPLFSWMEWELFQLNPDASRLAGLYPKLKRHHQCVRDLYLRPDGLYVGDALGCGMDDLPRWPRDWDGQQGVVLPLERQHVNQTDEEIHPGTLELTERTWCRWNEQGRFIDTTAQMALDALSLSRLADQLGEKTDAQHWRSEHAQLAEAINQHCWNEDLAFYFDLGFGEQVPRFHLGAYWTLLAEVVPNERRSRFLAHLSDPQHFGTTTPLPALSASDPDYHPEGGYWLGGVWAPTVYMVLKGLWANREQALAQRLADRIHQNVATVLDETGTLWENYAPGAVQQGQPAQPDFVGWSGLFTVALPREFSASR